LSDVLPGTVTGKDGVVQRERDAAGAGAAWTLPLYLVRDVSRWVAAADQDRVSRLLSVVIRRLADDELLCRRILVSVLEFADLTKTVQPLALAAEVRLPSAHTAGSEDARFSTLFTELAEILAADEARIARTAAECATPVVLLLTAGQTEEPLTCVRSAVTALVHGRSRRPGDGPLRILAQTLGREPAPLVNLLNSRVARSTPRLADEDDADDTMDDLFDAVWQAAPYAWDPSPTPSQSQRAGPGGGAGFGASPVRQSALGPLARVWDDDATVGFDLLDARRREELGAVRYLRHRSARRRTLSATDLFHQTTIWAGADIQTRHWIRQRLEWPVRLVVPDHDPSGVCGVLIPTPASPFPPRETSSGPGGRAWQDLIQDPADPHGDGIPAADDVVTRTALCAAIAETIAFLHHHRLLLLDQRLTGLRYVLQPRPAVAWSDCGSAFGGTPAAPVRWSAPAGWQPPEARADRPVPASEHAVRYLLARLIGACLAPDRTPGGDPDQLAGRLNPEGRRLLAAGLSPDPASRPSAAAWRDHLRRRLRELTSPPEIVDLLVTPRTTHEGGEITVCWRTLNATEVQVLAPAGAPVRVTGEAALDGRTTVSLTTSGPVDVVARNRFGRQQRSAGTVRALPLPSLAVPAVVSPAPVVALSTDPAASPLPLLEAVQRLTEGPLDLAADLVRGLGLIVPDPHAVSGPAPVPGPDRPQDRSQDRPWDPDPMPPGPFARRSRPRSLPLDPATWFADPPVSIPGRPRRRK
jgi:hypothetical protein